MRSPIRSFAVYICALGLLLSTAWAQDPPSYKELPNFHRVTETLYRGAQPLSGGLKKLSELGIRSVINLRGEDDVNRQEEKEAEAAGLRYFSLPMPGLSAPSDEQVNRAMTLIENPDNQPVFVHCKRGSDRTGTIIAVYRISHDGWSADQATAEAKKHGMSWMEFGMKGYIADYYKRQIRVRQTQQAPAAAVSK
ncbi:MAG TPA: tyrosine-protein phosphatase [Blastocatellia bacterium]|nr:tyrosine-protein phosphatase [Blastocatellia bacterium]